MGPVCLQICTRTLVIFLKSHGDPSHLDNTRSVQVPAYLPQICGYIYIYKNGAKVLHDETAFLRQSVCKGKYAELQKNCNYNLKRNFTKKKKQTINSWQLSMRRTFVISLACTYKGQIPRQKKEKAGIRERVQRDVRKQKKNSLDKHSGAGPVESLGWKRHLNCKLKTV